MGRSSVRMLEGCRRGRSFHFSLSGLLHIISPSVIPFNRLHVYLAGLKHVRSKENYVFSNFCCLMDTLFDVGQQEYVGLWYLKNKIVRKHTQGGRRSFTYILHWGIQSIPVHVRIIFVVVVDYIPKIAKLMVCDFPKGWLSLPCCVCLGGWCT